MKPVIHVIFLVLFLALAAMMPAQPAGGISTWTRTDGQAIQAGFLRMEGDAVVVLRDGNELTIPFSMLASDALRQAKELGKQSSEPADVLQIRHSLDAYVQSLKFGGFYDYDQLGREIDFTNLDPAEIELPVESWPIADKDGLRSFLQAVQRLHAFTERTDPPPLARHAVFVSLLKVFADFPFLRWQAYEDETPVAKAGQAVPNNIFVQFMSRRLLLLAEKAQPKINSTLERRAAAASLFPASRNGRAGAALFEKHGILLAGFGVRADVESKAHRTPLSVTGWKSTRGPRHGGGVFDYAYFTTDYLAEATQLFDLLPRHLIAGGGPSKAMTTMTCHGYYYIYEMEDFARKYYPGESDARAWFGYLHGQALNVFGPATTDFDAGITVQSFRTNDLAGERRRKVPAHSSLVTVAHEATHYLHSTVAYHRPDYARRLDQILALGVREKSNIRAIDGDLRNFAGSSMPAWEWFQKTPQESIATMANVFYLDPLTVCQWCAAVAGKDHVVGPLNHLLWLIDAHSLDADYRETDRTFLLTLQPSGRKFDRIDCSVTRDGQRRLTSLTLPGSTLKFAYNAEGIAHLAKQEP